LVTREASHLGKDCVALLLFVGLLLYIYREFRSVLGVGLKNWGVQVISL